MTRTLAQLEHLATSALGGLATLDQLAHGDPWRLFAVVALVLGCSFLRHVAPVGLREAGESFRAVIQLVADVYRRPPERPPDRRLPPPPGVIH